MKKLVRLKNGNDKCPHCGTIFHNNMESLHPWDVAVREEFKKRRSDAAKRGWKTRRGVSQAKNRKGRTGRK